MARIVVFGGRDYAERHIVFAALDHIDARIGIEKLAHGGATGADQHAEVWAVVRKNMRPPNKRVLHADWDDLSHPDAVIRKRSDGRLYDARAGLRRNQKLVVLRPDFGVQFPGAVGTAHMRRCLDAAGIPVFQVYGHAFNAHVQARLDEGW